MADFNKLKELVGEGWANFLHPFMCPGADGKCPYDEIGATIRDEYEKAASGKGPNIFPLPNQIFRAFKETPWEETRVVILGQDPYFIPGFANGLAFATDNKQIPKSLSMIYDAIERDVYGGLDLTKASRTGVLGKPDANGDVTLPWTKQGVLLLNTALTVREQAAESHIELWRPFTEYIINNIWRLKRGMIFVGWGAKAKDLLMYKTKQSDDPDGPDALGEGKGVNMFFAHILTDEHPSFAARENRPWQTNCFSKVNLIITGNGYGKPIIW